VPEFKTVPALPYKELERSAWKPDVFAANSRAVLAIDGKPDTVWRAGKSQARYQDFILDFGSSQSFERLELNSGAFGSETVHAWARDFLVEASNDGKTWTTVAGAAGAPRVTLVFQAQRARYLRLTLWNEAEIEWAISDLKLFTT
jgi:hypothetical protein